VAVLVAELPKEGSQRYWKARGSRVTACHRGGKEFCLFTAQWSGAENDLRKTQDANKQRAIPEIFNVSNT